MNTASTKSGKKARKAAAAELRSQKSAAPAPPAPVTHDLPERVWWIAVIAILLIAAVLRLYDLDLVPLHHDEGVNGNFLVRLVRDGDYRYDPANYHGPTLYYFAAWFPWIVRLLFGTAARDNYGLTTFMIRLVPAVFGLATIALVFPLRRRLGTIGTLSAALMLAVSPGAVYLSRYFIHETQFVFFTLAIVVAGLRFYETRNPLYLILASASAALLFATKETAIISMGVLLIAFATTHIYRWLYRSATATSSAKSRRPVAPESAFRRFVGELGTTNLALSAAIAVIVFVFLNVLFYSSFFSNSQGVYDALKTFEIWKKTGETAHVHAPYQYLIWLASQEGPILFTAVIGAAMVVIRPKNAFALFVALWAFGLVAAYSLIKYKTPWLVLNFVVPLALIGGYVMQVVYDLERGQLRLVAVLLVITLSVGVYQTIDLNFVNYDNDDSYYVYVYAHTKRGMLELVDNVEQLAAERDKSQTGITIVSPDYWPLPWYLRNYSRVGYYGRMAPSTEHLIIASEAQKTEMEQNFSAVYRQVESKDAGGSYELRPGVKLLLYVRRSGL
ncbi:MAG TPA: flippase activity-associated protein Agl23 [Pyrinomonadaceae bacterium]|nr:flippase activity-associated protein Agl23 [Pyrinomonadaceae bacterium]